jgi:hypothetical protein
MRVDDLVGEEDRRDFREKVRAPLKIGKVYKSMRQSVGCYLKSHVGSKPPNQRLHCLKSLAQRVEPHPTVLQQQPRPSAGLLLIIINLKRH